MNGVVAALFSEGEQVGLLFDWQFDLTDPKAEKWRVKFKSHWIERNELEVEVRLYLDDAPTYLSHVSDMPTLKITPNVVKDEFVITGKGGWTGRKIEPKQ